MSPRRVTDPAALKALAQPLRLRLYYALVIAGRSTATGLAENLDISASLISYHLRQLARHGYVELDTGSGEDGRERWWRPTSVGFSWSPADLGQGPEGAMAEAEASRQLDAHRAAYRQRWLDSQPGWEPAWRTAAVSTDNPLLRMTPAELTTFGEEFHALLDSWRDRLDHQTRPALPADDSTPGTQDSAELPAEQVMIVLQAFPFRP